MKIGDIIENGYGKFEVKDTVGTRTACQGCVANANINLCCALPPCAIIQLGIYLADVIYVRVD